MVPTFRDYSFPINKFFEYFLISKKEHDPDKEIMFLFTYTILTRDFNHLSLTHHPQVPQTEAERHIHFVLFVCPKRFEYPEEDSLTESNQ